MEVVIIRFIRGRRAYNGLRGAVRAAGHTGGGILDVNPAAVVATAHRDDEPGGIVLRVEDVAGAEVAGCDGYGGGLGVEGVAFAVVVEELGGRKGVQMLALVAQKRGKPRCKDMIKRMGREDGMID